MKSLTSMTEFETAIRKMLINQSELVPSFVRNALSRYGTPLNKTIDESILDSITETDCLLLFEVQTEDNLNNVSMTENDSSITSYRAFNVHCILYGDPSTFVASKLSARIRTAKVRQTLYDQGIHVDSCSTPISINEFLNDEMWLRNDFDIHVSCQFSFSQIDTEYDINETNSLTIL